jgi:hypothetical protein
MALIDEATPQQIIESIATHGEGLNAALRGSAGCLHDCGRHYQRKPGWQAARSRPP